jgi:DNA-binding transcriptional ArsR family regulator
LPAKRRDLDAAARLDELDTLLSALAHRVRRHILLVVRFRGGAMTAGEIASRFHCTWPTVSRHLRVLERTGLLRQEKRGRTRVYAVDPERLVLVREWLDWLEHGEKEDAKTTKRGKRA